MLPYPFNLELEMSAVTMCDCQLSSTRILVCRGGKVSDHGIIGPRKVFEFPENISPRKKKNCHNLDNRRNSEENHDLRNAIISASITIVRLCINVLDHME